MTEKDKESELVLKIQRCRSNSVANKRLAREEYKERRERREGKFKADEEDLRTRCEVNG